KKLSEWISSEQDWEVIGFVAGKGTTTEVQNYSFTDNLTHTLNLNQMIRYRLKQIDYDGSFKFSSEIEIEIKSPDIFSLEQNYPNPFNPTTKIKYSIPTVTLRQAQSDNWVTLKVYDVLGNEITTLVNERKPAGNYEVEFSGSDLTSGIYFYQLKSGLFMQTKKMVLLR
ncbi:MAG TPA: T9SS type A sorting domain-containing protein, partial [Ignavibacteriaceae bacterium]|nr:T9SS type A sorting domain-containing protein [Ignavibacteriaceae bacterium]